MESARPAFGAFGDLLATALRTEFFAWFQLEQIERRRAEHGTEDVVFAPSGPKFRALVRFTATVEATERLQALTLALAQSFIMDSRDAPFAGDIAASFLATGTNAEDGATLTDLMNELRYPRHLAVPMIMRSAPPPRPLEPTPAYRTFLGRQPAYEQALSSTILDLVNVVAADGVTLQMRLRRAR